MYRCTART